MHLRQNRVYRRQVYKTGTIFSVGPTTVRYLLLLLLGVFSLLFLVQSTQGAQTLAAIRTEDRAQNEQSQEMTTLEVQSSRLQSLQNLNQFAASQGMIPIGAPEAVVITGSE